MVRVYPVGNTKFACNVMPRQRVYCRASEQLEGMHMKGSAKALILFPDACLHLVGCRLQHWTTLVIMYYSVSAHRKSQHSLHSLSKIDAQSHYLRSANGGQVLLGVS